MLSNTRISLQGEIRGENGDLIVPNFDLLSMTMPFSPTVMSTDYIEQLQLSEDKLFKMLRDNHNYREEWKWLSQFRNNSSLVIARLCLVTHFAVNIWRYHPELEHHIHSWLANKYLVERVNDYQQRMNIYFSDSTPTSDSIYLRIGDQFHVRWAETGDYVDVPQFDEALEIENLRREASNPKANAEPKRLVVNRHRKD